MLDWLGSVQIRKRTETRVELDLTRATAWTGWAMTAGGIYMVTLAPLWATLLGAIGILLVMLFMIIVYRLPGVIASLALVFYMEVMLVLLIVLTSVSLTLPGIAGIILSVGMAVGRLHLLRLLCLQCSTALS